MHRLRAICTAIMQRVCIKYSFSSFANRAYASFLARIQRLPLKTQSGYSVASNFFVLCSHAQHPLYTLTWKHQPLFRAAACVLTGDVLGLYICQQKLSHLYFFIVCLIPYLRFCTYCTMLQCFYADCIQSNQKLARSLLKQSVHWGSALFPCQGHEGTEICETE
jgi:hypothetical protein